MKPTINRNSQLKIKKKKALNKNIFQKLRLNVKLFFLRETIF